MKNDDFNKPLPKLDPAFKRSKAMVWEEINSQIQHKESKKTRHLYVYSAAASLAILFATTLFLRLYSVTTVVPAGKHDFVMLPDGSSVELNAGSMLRHNPYWWFIKRELKFEGEGFFKVEKGSSFTVASNYGTTKVLGTSFNIRARKNIYSVTCYTGKVEVINSRNNQSVQIVENQQALIQASGPIVTSRQTEKAQQQTISWKDNTFLFHSTPLTQVLEEIELQYGVVIRYNSTIIRHYTGNFSRRQDVDHVIRMLCLSLQLHSEKIGDTFLLIEKHGGR